MSEKKEQDRHVQSSYEAALQNMNKQEQEKYRKLEIINYELEAKIKELEVALTQARRQLGQYGLKGPKQIGRALNTIDEVLE